MREGGKDYSLSLVLQTVRNVSPTFSLLNSEQYIRPSSLYLTMIENEKDHIPRNYICSIIIEGL